MSKREKSLAVGKQVSVGGEKSPAIGAGEKAYARTATRLMIAGAVWKLWDELRRDQGLDQQWLADRLGKDKSRVSRLLKAPGNWTIDTVADVLEAMEGRLTVVEAKLYRDVASSTSAIEPSMTGLRESGRLWAVLQLRVAPGPGASTWGGGDDLLSSSDEVLMSFATTSPLRREKDAE